jgi:hypothetical protein
VKVPAKFALLSWSVLTFAAPLSADAVPKDRGWQHVDEDDGIQLWEHQIPGQLIPGFRGQVHIDVGLAPIISAIEDYRAHPKWMHRCAESTVLKQLNELESVMYNRTDSPWPVADRDVVVRTRKDVSPDGNTVLMSFKNVSDPLKPQVKGVVRLPKLIGHYKLTRVGPNKTLVEYQVEADPGGSLPDWIVERVAKDMPYQTLSHLRDRVVGKS